MSETVRVEFDPPRECQETDKQWGLWADGEQSLWLPKSETQLERKGEVVVAVTVPRWLAEKVGLASTSSFQETDNDQDEQTNDTMSRGDWFTLGITMALIIRGDPIGAAVQEAAREGRHLAQRSR